MEKNPVVLDAPVSSSGEAPAPANTYGQTQRTGLFGTPHRASGAVRSVLIVEDHPLFLIAIRSLLTRVLSDIEVGTADSMRNALARLDAQPAPALVLLDLTLPDSAGIKAVHSIVDAHPEAHIIAISAADDPVQVGAAFCAGVRAFASKSAPPDFLVDLVGRAIQGKLNAREYIGVNGPQNPRNLPQINLTARQLEVLSLICKGYANKVISSQLDITEQTTKAHISAIFRELGVVNRTQAVLVAKRLGVHTDEGAPQPT